MHSNNISRIEKVAKGLGSINEEVVYVGGSVAEFYVIDSAKSDVRQTMDVDCVTHLKSYPELTSLEKRLRSCGFQKADEDLKEFFKEEFAKMLKRTNIREEIECKLPYGEENRVDYIIEMIKKLS